MKSLFDKSNSQEIIDRINKLKPDTKAEWGKMNVAQMLAHAQAPMHVAFGELKLKRTLIGLLFGGIAKKQFVDSEKPFKPNLPTDKTFVIADSRTFESEKKKLIDLINTFTLRGESGIVNLMHPFFGRMTANEWATLQWKHLDHHLNQFGV